jgi:hypothetical protein
MIPISIPVPIGINHIAIARASTWKVVSCGCCHESYAFRLNVEARGSDLDLLFLDGAGSKERAAAHAREKLIAKTRCSVASIPCPHCGTYQDDMVRQMKEEAEVNLTQVVGAMAVAISLVPLAFAIRYAWIFAVVGSTVGVALLAYGYLLSFRYDPNAGDPAPRKALGQKHSVWGEQLVDLLKDEAKQTTCIPS